MRYHVVPLELAEANALVAEWHRHHAPSQGGPVGYGRNPKLLIQTYILESELGTSLVAAGWTYDGPAGGGQWKHTDGRPRRTDQPIDIKGRWSKALASRPGLNGTPLRASKNGSVDGPGLWSQHGNDGAEPIAGAANNSEG